MSEIRVLSATGMLGSGFREETLRRGMALRPDFIGVDSGSTDAGPFELTFDVIFKDRASYEKVRAARVINAQWFARTYQLEPGVVTIIHYDAANAIKITIPRPVISGDIDDTDVFGGQQYGPLVDLDVP